MNLHLSVFFSFLATNSKTFMTRDWIATHGLRNAALNDDDDDEDVKAWAALRSRNVMIIMRKTMGRRRRKKKKFATKERMNTTVLLLYGPRGGASHIRRSTKPSVRFFFFLYSYPIRIPLSRLSVCVCV